MLFMMVVALPLLGWYLFGGELSAWSSIRRQITQRELYRRQEKRFQFRCLEKCGSVTHGAIKNASLTMALDPTGGVVVVGTHVPGAHIRFVRIYTGQHMQFLPGVRAGGKEMLKLIGVGEASSIKRFDAPRDFGPDFFVVSPVFRDQLRIVLQVQCQTEPPVHLVVLTPIFATWSIFIPQHGPWNQRKHSKQ
jgi:hypothetical protein